MILAFVGAGVEQSTTDPNQEIVVRFYANAVDDSAAQNVISDIAHQLESLGAEDVRISKMPDGKLRILYYSSLDVSVIKKSFHKRDGFPSPDEAFPEGKSPLDLPTDGSYGYYNLDIAKIQEDSNQDNPFQGVMVEVSLVKDQSLKPKITSKTTVWYFSFQSEPLNPDYSSYPKGADGHDKSSYKIPEVRAGPVS